MLTVQTCKCCNARTVLPNQMQCPNYGCGGGGGGGGGGETVGKFLGLWATPGVDADFSPEEFAAAPR